MKTMRLMILGLLTMAAFGAATGSASATLRGIDGNTPLTTATGRLTLSAGGIANVCDLTLFVTLETRLIAGGIGTRIGGVTGIQQANCTLRTVILIGNTLAGDGRVWPITINAYNLVTNRVQIAVNGAGFLITAGTSQCLFFGNVFADLTPVAVPNVLTNFTGATSVGNNVPLLSGALGTGACPPAGQLIGNFGFNPNIQAAFLI